jgi:hypothetical protein
MDFKAFSKLSLNGRAAIVFGEGDYVASIKEYSFLIKLFIVDDTFIEVFYNIHSNELEDIAVLEPDDRRLSAYSHGIDIQDLFK